MRFSIILIAFSLAVLLTFSLGAQPTFSYTYDYNLEGNVAVAMAQDDSSNIYIVDYAACSQGSREECVSIRKVKESGNTLWAKQYEFGTGYSYRGGGHGCIKITPSQEIVIAGDEELQPNNEDAFFLGFWNLNGELIDTFFFDFKPRIRNSFVRSVLVKDDSTFYVFGNEQLGEFNATIFLSKINRRGEELWRRHYGDGDHWLPDPEHIAFYQDNLLLMSVTEKNNDGRNGMIIITDLEGQNEQIEVLEYEQEYWWPRIYAIPSISGGVIYSFSRDSQAILRNNLIVRKLDEILNEEWLYEFQFRRANYINFIVENNHGEILGVGGAVNDIDLVSWIFLISAEGELLWEYYLDYNPNGINIPTELIDGKFLDDRSIFLIGAASEPDSIIIQNQNGYILRLDSNGLCQGDSCPTIIVLYSDVVELGADLKHEVVVYPNPTAGEFSLVGDLDHVSQIVLHDITGRQHEVWQNRDAGFAKSYDISHLASGMYVISFYREDGKILGSGRIMKK